MPTLKDVAALAGVSAATVSLYLNGKSAGRISQQKQKEIEEALKQLSYQPSSASRQLKELGTSPLIYTVAVYWAADPRSALLGKVMAGIQSSLAKNQMTNCNIVICPFKPNELYKEKGLIDPKLYNYDAAIIANTAVMDMQYLDSIMPPIPVVLLNRRSDQYSYVSINNQKMGASLADMIADRGFKSVSVFRSQSPYLAVDDRVTGFINGCRAKGVDMPNHALFYTDNSTDGGIQAAAEFLKLSERPDVVFCDSDSIALGALYVFYQAGVRIPKDLSVISIGLHHSSTSKCSIPPLTVSEVPLTQMAEGCMDYVIRALTDKSYAADPEPVHVELETKIIVRESFQ